MLKKLIEEAIDGGTSTADIGTYSAKLTTEPQKRKKKMKKKVIETNEKYEIYEEGDYTLFEFFNEQDFLVYTQGLKKDNPRIWRQTPATLAMNEALQKYRSSGFRVKYANQVSSPAKRNDYFF